MSEFDPWKLSSGLPLADTYATITDMEFVFDTEYSADAVVAKIYFQPDDEGAEPQHQLYSCGKNFEPIDGGEGVAHESGRNVNFSNQSGWGRFLNASIQTVGFREYADEVGLVPQNVAGWIGTRWYLAAEEIETSNPAKPNDPPKKRSIILPQNFMGTVDEPVEEEAAPAPVKAAPAKKAAAPASNAASDAIGELRAEEGGEELVTALYELAAGSEDHEDFMTAAMELDGVSGNRLAERVVMSSKPGSVWATRNDPV